MSFELPRSPRSLRFTGSVKALATPEPRNALARQRPMTAPPIPKPSPAARTNDAKTTMPRPMTRPMTAPPSSPPSVPEKLATARGQLPSLGDDDLPTQMLDRDDIGFGPPKPQAPAVDPNALPVPMFRSAEQVRDVHGPVAVIVPPKPPGGPISLPVWLVISLVCGFLSYRFVPAIFTSVERATGLLEANAGVDASTTAQ